MKTKSLLHLTIAGLVGLSAAAGAQSATHVVSITPPPGAMHVRFASNIVVRFDNAVDPATVTSSSFFVSGQTRGVYAGNFAFAANNTQVTFSPNEPFDRCELASIDVSSQIHDILGNPIRPWLSQFTVFSESSAAEFAQAQVYPAGLSPFSIFAFDLHHRGILDLVVANGAVFGGDSRTITVLTNNGNGRFTNSTDYVADPGTGSGPYSVWAFDPDGSGYGDIIAANRHVSETNGTIAVLRNNKMGGFNAPVLYPVGERPVCVVAGDINGDGFADVVVCHGGQSGPGSGLSLLFGDGTGTFGMPVIIDTGLAHSRVALADLDRDGDLDIIVPSDDINSMSILLNNGDGTFAPIVSFPVGERARAVGAADLNGDGAPELLTANQISDSVTIYTNLGNSFGGRIDLAVNGMPFGMVISDLDGNGFADVVTANYSGGSVFSSRSLSYILNRDGSTFDPHKELDTIGGNPVDVFAADVNNDGKPDLVSANLGNSVSVLINGPPTVVGRVFADGNGDCIQNGPDELGVGGRFLGLKDAAAVERFTMTRPDGSYGFVAPAGSYTLRLVTNAITSATCNNLIQNVNVLAGIPVTNNFGVHHICTNVVTCASVIGWPCPNFPVPCTITSITNKHGRYLCPCEPFRYAVTVCNNGDPMLPGTVVRLQLDQNVMFCRAPQGTALDPMAICNNNNNPTVTLGLAPQAQGGYGVPNPNTNQCPSDCVAMLGPIGNTGQIVEWTLGNALPSGDCCTFFVHVQVAYVPLGAILHAYPTVTAHCNPQNMQVVTHGPPCDDTIFCSFDPNDKAVSPPGCGPLGNIVPGTPLTYRVRFQNLGNAAARRVIIRDQLDPALNADTLEIVSTSHPVTSFEILPDRRMVWTFDGIHLPDATRDEFGSRGEVLYRVRPKASAGEGTAVLNSASIYFDWNDPVITVTTTNTIRGVPEPDARFGSALVSTNPWVADFTYTGGTADEATFAWDFGPEATPSNSTNQNASGITFASDGPKLVTLVVSRYGCVVTNQMVVWVGPCEGNPTLSIRRSENQAIISWTDCGILQVADRITGPWRDVVARSPHIDDISTRQRFYRTRK